MAAKKKAAKKNGEAETGDQGRLEGMPEPETPKPLYKYTRTFKAVRMVIRSKKEALKLKKLEIPLYSETVTRFQERDENADSLTEAEAAAILYLDENVQTLEEFHKEVGGTLSKTTMNCELMKPQKQRQRSN